jgi:hypothetical protein
MLACLLLEPNCAPIEVFIGVLGEIESRMLYQTKVLKPLSEVVQQDVADVFPSTLQDWELCTGDNRFGGMIQAVDSAFDKVWDSVFARIFISSVLRLLSSSYYFG